MTAINLFDLELDLRRGELGHEHALLVVRGGLGMVQRGPDDGHEEDEEGEAEDRVDKPEVVGASGQGQG